MKPRFHALTVAEIEQLTDDAVAITFAVPEHLGAAYEFAAGQHLTIRTPGDEGRRSYSIAAPEGSGRLRIGVKRLPGGTFSEGVVPGLSVGDALEVMTPMGRFGAALGQAKRPAFVAAGSGITPILSMVATALASEDVEDVLVVSCNRTQREVMFLEELADLKDRHLGRLQLIHVLSREQQESDLLSGRLDRDRMLDILRNFALGDGVRDGWFLCGPFDLVTGVREALLAELVDPGAVHTELFHAETIAPRPSLETPVEGTQVRATLDTKRSSFTVPPGGVVLDALLAVRGDAPYACKGGVCGTCRAKVVTGAVDMAANWALEPEELAAGYVLTCQSRPTTTELELDYDA